MKYEKVIPQKLGLVGSHGVGKTTLQAELAKRFIRENIDFYIITDTARKCPFKINKKTNFQSQLWIFNEQIKRESNGNGSIILSDRTVLDILAYSKYAQKYGNMAQQEFETIKKLVTNWIVTNPYYFLYVPIPEGLKIEDDGIRNTDIEYQKEIDSYIQDFMKEIDIDFMVLENDKDQSLTFNKIISIIKKTIL